ncbi:MAG: hypothetical protein ACQEQF_09515 [Bacillota bacterium]
MNYIAKCKKCNQKSIVTLNEEESIKEKSCPICKAEGKNLEIEISVEEALPSAELIQKAMGLQ